MNQSIPAVHAPPGDRRGPGGRRSDQTESPPDLFAAVLASSEGPPAQAAAPQARTAHAEGTKADRDSIGSQSQTATPAATTAVAAAQPAAVQPAPVQAAPAQAQALPATTPTAAAQLAATPPAGGEAAPVPAAAHTVQEQGPGRLPIGSGHGRHLPHVPAAESPISTSSAAQRPLPQPAGAVARIEGDAATAPAGQSAAAPVVTSRGGSAQPAADVATHALRAAPHAEPHTAGDQGGSGRRQSQPETAGAVRAAARGTGGQRARGTTAPAAPAQASTAARPATPPAAGSGEAQESAPPQAASPAPAAGPRLRVHELAASMQTVVRVARARGSATARITLRPAELGGVQVRLRCQSGAITAELTAETAAGAQALAQAGGELRRSLEAQGVNLLGLEVRVASDGAGPNSGEAHQQEGRNGGSPTGHANEEPDEITIEPARLPDPGAQVDVLA